VIKSGGEWVSSIDLENAIMAHPDVVEAAVIGVPDPAGTSGRWHVWCFGRAPKSAPASCARLRGLQADGEIAFIEATGA
jgi:acyl-CoA synthetase (AMP-forming)/AMP-acid ligase II